MKTGDYTTGEGHNHPALVADGKLIIGFTGGDRTGRGAVAAHDAETGEFLWKTYTVPEPGEPGSESWAESALPPLGGNTWGTISYDPELGRGLSGHGPTESRGRRHSAVPATRCIPTASCRLISTRERSCGTSRSSRPTTGTWTRPARAC